MIPSIRPRAWVTLGACLLALVVSACAGADLGIAARTIRADVQIARDNGAYHCAPAELAMAEANIEFGEQELEQGDYFRARDHLRIADANSREARRLSPPARCKQVRPVVARPTDSDGDGVPDAQDKCPAEPEDRDGFQDDDGCPELDNDGDGILDSKDKCPLEPEDADGFQDDDGCPEPDNDLDGVLDGVDKCPTVQEDRDGFEDNDGCPQKFALIEITQKKIEIKQTILFATGKAVIMPKSYDLLDEVATALKGRVTMAVRIEGHTDSRGNPVLNTRLSQARADSVKAYLVGKGVGSDRLDSRGFGPDQPLETNKTAAGREKNRRVEFVITKQ